MLRDVFQRGSVRQVVLANAIWLGVGVGASSLVDFSVAVYVTRALGPAEYGKLAFAFAFAGLFAALLDFGLTTAVTREFAQDQGNTRYFADILALKAQLGLVVVPLIAGAGLIAARDPVGRLLVLELGGYVFLLETINLFFGTFRAKQRMKVEAAFRLLQAGLLAVAIALALRVHVAVTAVGLAYVTVAAITLTAILATVIAVPSLRLPLRPMWRPDVWRKFATIGVYLALVRIAGDLTTNADSAILGTLGYLRETGWYNAAAKVNGLVLFPMGLITTAVFPALVSVRQASPAAFVRYWESWLRGTVVWAGLVASIVVIRADGIVTALFPAGFGPAGPALKILIFKAVLVYLHNVYYHLLLVFDQQQRLFIAMAIAAGVNIGLNALLIPRFSLYGAATAAVVAHGAIMVQYLFITARHAPVHPLPRSVLATLFAAVAAGGVTYMLFTLASMARLGLLLSLAVAAASYVTVFLAVSRLQSVLAPASR